jgi:hypothetical protein
MKMTMSKPKLLLCVAVLMASCGVSVAQRPHSRKVTTVPITVKTPPRRAPEIEAAMKDVSAARLKANIEKLVSFGTRLTISPATPEDIKAGRGIGAAREWIRSEFQRYSDACGGCLEVKEDRFTEGPAPRIPQPTEIVNVYAVLRGTDPEAAKHIFIISGHYDSRPGDTFDTKTPAPGANDDGSGTAVVLEAARVLSKHKFPGTIIFLTVAGEEQGLNGSMHFAKMAREQGWQIDGVLNDDTVGGDKSPGQKNLLRVFAEGIPLVDLQGTGDIKALRMVRGLGDENDSTSRELARYINQVAKTYRPTAAAASFAPVTIYRPDRYLRGGDHTSFNQQGYAAVRLTEWRENYDRQHQDPRMENGKQYGDLPQFLNYDFMANVARLNVATLASLASAAVKPTNVHLLTKDLTNDSTLTWDPVPNVTGYEVVWRDTTAPNWQNVKSFPASAKEATIDVSKDNVIFGLRTVVANGSPSLVVVPVPAR